MHGESRKSICSRTVDDLKDIPKKKEMTLDKLYHRKYTWAIDGLPIFFDKTKLTFTNKDKEIIKDIILDKFPEQHREKVKIFLLISISIGL
ncbi:MAG: hypothetical protein MJ252_16130 [archaeon]|nr:hypothetical protein [archaeon]